MKSEKMDDKTPTDFKNSVGVLFGFCRIGLPFWTIEDACPYNSYGNGEDTLQNRVVFTVVIRHIIYL